MITEYQQGSATGNSTLPLRLTWDPEPNTPKHANLPHTHHLNPVYPFPLDVPPHTIEVTRVFPLAGQWRYGAEPTMGYSLR